MLTTAVGFHFNETPAHTPSPAFLTTRVHHWYEGTWDIPAVLQLSTAANVSSC